jgi:hypothetical protein
MIGCGNESPPPLLRIRTEQPSDSAQFPPGEPPNAQSLEADETDAELEIPPNARRTADDAARTLTAAAEDNCCDEFAVARIIAGLPATRCLFALYCLFDGTWTRKSDFEKRTGESLKTKNVLVFCQAPNAVKEDNQDVEGDLARYVAFRLESHKIQTVDSDKVCDWLSENKERPTAIDVGAAFTVDYVVCLEIEDYELYEKDFRGELFRGRAGIFIRVFKMDESREDGDEIYSRDVVSRFPTKGPVYATQMSYDEFKKRYLSAISDEIGFLFYGKDAVAPSE